VSVGHVARILEKSGIATVIIAIRAFRDRLEAMTVPRLVITPHLMGRPLGAPGDSDRQRASILTALELLEKAERAGTVIEMTGV
jgi:hypothetical protein